MSIIATMPSRDGLIFSMQGGTTFDSAKNNTIINTGATATADHNGRAGRGWAFANNVGQIVSSNFRMPNKNDFTMSVGFMKSGNTSDSFGIGQIAGTDPVFAATVAYGFYAANTNELGFSVRDGSSNYSLRVPITQGVYYFATGGFNWTTKILELYINGVLVNSTVATNVTNDWLSYDLFIGRRGISPIRELNGSVDLVDIHNRYLSPSEIIYNYNYWLSH